MLLYEEVQVARQIVEASAQREAEARQAAETEAARLREEVACLRK